jgi:hypothetical protein
MMTLTRSSREREREKGGRERDNWTESTKSEYRKRCALHSYRSKLMHIQNTPAE